jgi:hypothetical protein
MATGGKETGNTGKQRSKEERKGIASTAGGEEGLEKGGGFAGKEAVGYFDLMIEFGMGEDFEAGAEGAALGVVCAVNEARNAGLDDGASTHGAGFEGDIESGAGQPVVAENARGFANNDDFGVRRGVVIANGAVAGLSEDRPFVDEQSADGNFAGFGRRAGHSERELHKVQIVGHANRRITRGRELPGPRETIGETANNKFTGGGA